MREEPAWGKAVLVGSAGVMALAVGYLAAPLAAESVRTAPVPVLVGSVLGVGGIVGGWSIRRWRRRHFDPLRGLGTAPSHQQVFW